MAFINTTCAGGEVVTPSPQSGSVGEWVKNHVTELYAAVNSGALVITGATRLYTTWPTNSNIPPATHTETTIRYMGPPPESNADFLDRHVEGFTQTMASIPPVP